MLTRASSSASDGTCERAGTRASGGATVRVRARAAVWSGCGSVRGFPNVIQEAPPEDA